MDGFGNYGSPGCGHTQNCGEIEIHDIRVVRASPVLGETPGVVARAAATAVEVFCCLYGVSEWRTAGNGVDQMNVGPISFDEQLRALGVSRLARGSC